MPSVGITFFTGTGGLAMSSEFVWYCQVVPIVEVPFVKLSISSVYEAQYLPTYGRCAFKSATAASNCVWVSS